MNYHVGLRQQRGRGIGSIFSGLIRGFAPIARKGLQFGKQILGSSLVKNIANSALESGKKAAINIAADLLEGKNVKNTAQKELDEAKNKIASTLRGQGPRKRKLKSKKTSATKKKKSRKSYSLLD
jgi:hypothetical protein